VLLDRAPDGAAGQVLHRGEEPGVLGVEVLGLGDDAGDVAERVDEGAIKATAAYEISKLQFADDQRAVAEKVVAEGLDHAGTVAEVKRIKVEREGKSKAGLKGRAAIRARPRTSRTPQGRWLPDHRRKPPGGRRRPADRRAEGSRRPGRGGGGRVG